MGIRNALGTGLFLVIIALMMPAAFYELIKTAMVFLESAQEAFTAAGILASHATDSFSH